MRETESIIGDDKYVSIDGGYFSYNYYFLDASNGNIISALDKADTAYTHQLPANNYGYWTANRLNVEPDEILESSIFWRDIYKVDEVWRQIIVKPDLVIQRKGNSEGLVERLDSLTGNVIWSSEDSAISNIAIANSTIFYLTTDSELVAADIDTGERIGFVQFTPKSTTQGTDYGYYVAAHNNLVAVYLGDSRQLFVFQYDPVN